MHPHQHHLHADMQLQPKYLLRTLRVWRISSSQVAAHSGSTRGVRKPTMELMTSLMNGALQCL